VGGEGARVCCRARRRGGRARAVAIKILIADDSKVSRLLLESALSEWGYQVEVAYDGITAWQALQGKDPPPLAILARPTP
jgi:CheY-like chemotaxis protein